MSAIRLRRGSILFGLLASYIAVLVLALATGMIAYLRAFSAVDEGVRQANLAILEHTQEIVDRRLDEIREMVSTLAYDPNINAMLAVADPTEPRGYSLMRRTWQSLPRFQATNRMIFDYYVNFRKSGVIMSPDVLSFHPERFYGSVLQHADLSRDEWLSVYFDTPHKETFLPPATVVFQGNSHSLMTYIQSLPLGYSPPHMATVLVYLREDALTSLLKRLELPDRGFAFIEDRSGHRLMTVSPGAVPAPVVERRSLLPRGYQAIVLNGETYHIAHTVSERAGWFFVAGVPERFLRQRIAGVRRAAVASLAASALLGGLVAFALAYRTSRPLTDLAARLRGRLGEGDPPGGGIDYITGTVGRLIERNRRFQDALQAQQPLIRAAFLDALLRGDWADERELQSHLAQTDLELKGANFLCMILRITGFGDAPSADVLRELHSARVVVRDCVVALIGDRGAVHDADADTLALVLRMAPPAAEELFRGIARSLRFRYRIAVRGFGGRAVTSLKEVHLSYAEAQQTAAREASADGDSVAWFTELPAAGNRYFYPMEVEWSLMRSVRTGNRARATEILDSLRKENTEARTLSRPTMRTLLFELRGTCVKLLDQMPHLTGDQVVGFQRQAAALEADLTSAMFFDRLSELVSALASTALERKRSHTAELIGRILEYLDAAYVDPEMSLARAASHFGLSDVYLSQLFKSESGSNFSGYVARKRLDRARDLLHAGLLSIDEIAQEVGYSSPDTFRRAFRRSFGTSPRAYRYGLRSEETARSQGAGG